MSLASGPIDTDPGDDSSTPLDDSTQSVATAVEAPPAIRTQPFRPLGAWIFLTVVLNILLATAYGLPGDQEFWVDWTRQLSNKGYAGLVANYPPVFMHCLWLIGKLLLWVGVTAEQDLLMRFLVNTPVLLAHVGLVALVARVARKPELTDRYWNMLIGFVVLNPALLMDGPIWGQVDVIFCVFMALALWLLIEGRALLWVLPLFTLAVFAKFQAICVAAVVLPLFWHRRSAALFLGALPAVVVAALLLVPYWLAGAAGSMIKQAYLEAASLYPLATLHADNLWFLLGLDEVADGVYVFDRMQSTDGWRRFFTVKVVGIALFAMWSTILMISSWRVDDANRHWRNAVLCALGFFVWLPGMHERYLMPAVVLALVASAQCRRHYAIAVVLTFIASMNILFIHSPKGGLLPYLVAACVVAYSLVLIAERYWVLAPWRRIVSAPLPVWIVLSVISWFLAFDVHVKRVRPDTSMDAYAMDATVIRGRSSRQDWGKLGIDSSALGKQLRIAGKPFLKGFGTHADSNITVPIPKTAKAFTALVGIDDHGAGEVEFRVLVDGVSVWSSGLMRSGDAARRLTVDVSGKKMLELVADPHGVNHGDHADWVEPRFTFDHPQ